MTSCFFGDGVLAEGDSPMYVSQDGVLPGDKAPLGISLLASVACVARRTNGRREARTTRSPRAAGSTTCTRRGPRATRASRCGQNWAALPQGCPESTTPARHRRDTRKLYTNKLTLPPSPRQLSRPGAAPAPRRRAVPALCLDTAPSAPCSPWPGAASAPCSRPPGAVPAP